MANRGRYENYLQNANIKAFLKTISVSEGANYNTLVGGGIFTSYADHPNILIPKYNSTAAGAYQIIHPTWLTIKNSIPVGDFSPHSQDLCAVRLLEIRGVITYIMSGQFNTTINKCVYEWASFPVVYSFTDITGYHPAGKSYYGQHDQNLQYLRNIYLGAGGTINENNANIYKDEPVVASTNNKRSASSSNSQQQEPKIPEFATPVKPPIKDDSKDIVTIKDKTLKLPDLKLFVGDDSESTRSEAEFTGEMMPFIIYNQYSFSIKEIHDFTLTYDDYYPRLNFTINNENGRFTVLTLPKENDIISLYLKPHVQQFKPIYIQFEIENINNNDNMVYFNCIIKLPKLFTEVNKAYKNITSYETYLQVSTDLELGYSTNVLKTNDAQTRILAKETYLNFMKREIKDCYKDDKSFFTFYLDFYYNLTLVDLNNQFGVYNSQDTLIGIMKNVADEKWADGKEIKINGSLILSNSRSIRGTTSYISDYKLVSNIGANKNDSGHIRYVQFFDTELGTFENHKITPNYETIDTNMVRFDGTSDLKNQIIKSTYLGTQQTEKNSSNVHDNQKFARANNFQNLQEIDKMYLIVHLEKPNFHIYRYQSIPVTIFEHKVVNIDLSFANEAQKKRLAVEGNNNSKEYMLQQYSGHYVVKNIKYVYDTTTFRIKQELQLMRREWPKIDTDNTTT